jgi:hypothetical protein
MKLWAGLVLLLAVFAVSVLLTAVEGFRNCSAEDRLVLERLGVFQGHVAPLFASPFVWSRYPAASTHLTALVSERGFLMTVPLLLAALCVPHALGRPSFPLSIGICVAVAAVPYVAGMVILQGNTLDPPHVGRWLAVMILGPLYALIICAVICVLELLRSRSRPRSL